MLSKFLVWSDFSSDDHCFLDNVRITISGSTSPQTRVVRSEQQRLTRVYVMSQLIKGTPQDIKDEARAVKLLRNRQLMCALNTVSLD